MALEKVRLGSVQVSRLAIGGNPFSGFSHQSAQRDRQMRRYYTAARIKEALRRAEAAGINTFFGRADNHVMRLLEEYWDEGGSIQWFAQTASERPDYVRNIHAAADTGAKGCYLHGGQTDYFYHHGQTDDLGKALAEIRSRHMVAGLAAHPVAPHEWIRDHLDPDFQMCCYYDPSPRIDRPDHIPTEQEKFDPAQRERVARTIATIPRPVVHYKVLGAGRTPPEQAFRYVAKVIRPPDVVLVGFFLGDDPDLIETTAALFERIVQPAVAQSPAR